jgi:glycosyltransferase involved in cell wall biosynthesis
MTQSPAFDGIICIGGEDWWYHNRGHFDFQIMRRIARDTPVLFVNSLGVRFPSVREGGQFLARIKRKLGSLGRGLVHVENNFHVLSPLSMPGQLGEAALGWALAPQIKYFARRIGIERPLLWLHCPAGAGLIDAFATAPMVMQRTDRFESFPEGDPAILGRQIAAMKARADLVVYCNADLLAEERTQVARSLLVTHGVDYDHFVTAGTSAGVPLDVAQIPGPRVGFIGGIDAHTFDPPLFLEVVRTLPQVQFVMVGGSSLHDGWCPHPNVHFLGRKPYDEVAAYMAACDALIMPWNNSDWIKGCNPIKLKEYLAVGRPVVTTPFPALAPYADLVRVAADGAGFAAALSEALSGWHDPATQRDRVRLESWEAKAAEVMAACRGLEMTSAKRLAA